MDFSFEPFAPGTVYDNRGRPQSTNYTINFTADGTPFTAKYSEANRFLTVYFEGEYIAGSAIAKPFGEELVQQIIKCWFTGDEAVAELAGWTKGVKKLRF